MSVVDKCPICNKNDCIPEYAYTNVECYGGNFHKVRCVHCKNVLDVCMSRVIKISSIEKSESKESDWG